jgi:hypothetical protein
MGWFLKIEVEIHHQGVIGEHRLIPVSIGIYWKNRIDYILMRKYTELTCTVSPLAKPNSGPHGRGTPLAISNRARVCVEMEEDSHSLESGHDKGLDNRMLESSALPFHFTMQ